MSVCVCVCVCVSVYLCDFIFFYQFTILCSLVINYTLQYMFWLHDIPIVIIKF